MRRGFVGVPLLEALAEENKGSKQLEAAAH